MYRITERLQTHNFQQIKNVVSHQNKSFRNPARHYDSSASDATNSRGRSFKRFLYASGATIVVVGGIISYARFDKKFRIKLNEYVPGSDAFIKFVYQEEKSYLDNVKNSISDTSENMINNVYKFVGKNEKSEEPKSAVTVPPPLLKISKPAPVPVPSAEKKEAADVVPVTPKEKYATKVKTEEPHIEKYNENSVKMDNYQKYNVSDLEKKATEAVNRAIVAYNNAINELKNYREEVADLIEKSVQKEDHNVWFKIKEKTELKEKSIKKAEKEGKHAWKKIEHLRLLINDSKIDLDLDVKRQIEDKIKNIVNDFVLTKAVFAQEREDTSMTDKFSKKVEESRQILSKELGLLFPSLLIDSEMVVTDEELDLFVAYTCQLVNFYQKELNKLETIGKSRINRIIEQSKAGNPDVIKEVVAAETEHLKREFAQELMKQELKLKRDFEMELMSTLRRQAEVHSDHLNEVISLKEKEMDRILKRDIDEKIEDMRIIYNRQLASIIGRMKGLDIALKEKAIAEKQAKRSQLLWNACQSLILTISSGTTTKGWEEQLKPLENEIIAISKAAAEEDNLVDAVIASIPSEAISRGVFNELALRNRFLNLEKIAYRLANLPEGYSSIPAIILSYLQSFLLIKLGKPIPTNELANEPFDVSSLNNYDILCRARYWLDRSDFQQALRYMNLLKGAARSVSDEWMNEVRIFLETRQAANVLLSHAVYSNYVYLQNSS